MYLEPQGREMLQTYFRTMKGFGVGLFPANLSPPDDADLAVPGINNSPEAFPQDATPEASGGSRTANLLHTFKNSPFLVGWFFKTFKSQVRDGWNKTLLLRSRI